MGTLSAVRADTWRVVLLTGFSVVGSVIAGVFWAAGEGHIAFRVLCGTTLAALVSLFAF